VAREGKVRRLWGRDASLWSGRDEAQWLGWLGITNGQLAHIERLTGIRDAARKAGFSHVLLLGMGGSSLGPEAIKTTFGRISGFPELHVLDSTDPAQVKAIENKLDLKSTLFIVSSKSGSTLEPNVFKQYFFDLVERLVGPEEAGRRFLAITDPGSKMQQVAERDGFRRVFLGWPSIGERYSVLSDFGLVPAAIWAWTFQSSWTGRRAWSVPACRPYRLHTTPVSCSAPSSAWQRRNSVMTS
jgi:transaldolase/glucose-6-phosphate isomerase